MVYYYIVLTCARIPPGQVLYGDGVGDRGIDAKATQKRSQIKETRQNAKVHCRQEIY